LKSIKPKIQKAPVVKSY